MRVALWAALGALFVVGGIDPAIGHEWHDVTGQYSREGDFADLRDGRVDVRLTDGRTAHVALGKLCEADQTYVNEMMAARGGEAVALTGDATQNDGAAETLRAASTRSYRRDADCRTGSGPGSSSRFSGG